MKIIHENIEQGTDEWLALRRGIMTASEMKHIITPTLKTANNDKSRAHMWELLAQRVSGFVEPAFISDDMLRGKMDEVDALIDYGKHYGDFRQVGFITNDKWGVTIGYSPDGLVGDKGGIEVKSRRQKFQIETIINGTMPDDFLIQVQTGMLVAELDWIDFVSRCAGLPQVTIRVYPDKTVQDAIVAAAKEFEEKLQENLNKYQSALSSGARLIPTTRKIEQEIVL